MSKSAQIRKLYASGVPTSEIARRVGVLIEYVGVVIRRAGGMCDADIKYYSKPGAARRKKTYNREYMRAHRARLKSAHPEAAE